MRWARVDARLAEARLPGAGSGPTAFPWALMDGGGRAGVALWSFSLLVLAFADSGRGGRWTVGVWAAARWAGAARTLWLLPVAGCLRAGVSGCGAFAGRLR